MPILLELTVCRPCIGSFCTEFFCNDLIRAKIKLSMALLLVLRTADCVYGCVCFSSLPLSAPPPLAGRIIEINFITTCQVLQVREQSQPRIKLHPAGKKEVAGAVSLMLHLLMKRWG